MKKVLMILWHDLFKPFLDPRPYKEAKSLISFWYDLEFLCLVNRSWIKKMKYIKDIINWITINYIFYDWWKLFSLNFFNSLYSRYKMYKFWKRIIYKISPNIIHCHDSDTLKFWWIYKKYNDWVNLIYDSHEICTEMWHWKLTKFYIKLFEKPYIKYIDIFISANDSRIPIFKNIYPILNWKKIYSLYNYPVLKEFNYDLTRCSIRKELNIKSDTKVFLYQWWLSKWRWILNIIKAFEELDNNNWKFIINWGSELQVKKLKEKIVKYKYNFIFTWFVNNIEVEKYMISADVWFVSLLNVSLNNYWAAPNKLYEYMMTKNFIIWPNFEILNNFIIDNKIWIVTDFWNVNDIKMSIKKVLNISIDNLNKCKNNWYNMFLNSCNWDISEKKLNKIYSLIK